jgi:hypothetical protein
MRKVLALLKRHSVITAVTIIILGLPIILAMSPLVLFLTAMWGYVVFSEAHKDDCDKK